MRTSQYSVTECFTQAVEDIVGGTGPARITKKRSLILGLPLGKLSLLCKVLFNLCLNVLQWNSSGTG